VLRIILIFVGLGLALAADRVPAAAQEKLDFAYSAIDPAGYTGFWMASQKNFFEQYGVSQGKIVYISGGAVITASLLSGEVGVLLVQASAPIAVKAKGGDAVIFGATENILPYYIFLGPGLKTLKDIEGKKASISRVGSGSHASLLALFKEAGVDARKVTFVASGEMNSRLAAFSSGAVDLVGLPPPYHLRLLEQGYKISVNLLDERVPWAQVVLAARQSWVENNPAAAKNVLKAVAEGNYYALAHPDEAKTLWRRYLRTSDAKILDESFIYFRKTFVPNLMPDAGGLANIRDFAVAPDAKSADAGTERFVSSRAVTELVREGFFQKLAAKYGVSPR
jgi:ABC-type nitrate/sulfonate/bicarbonate transport system substrate-binding protein